MISTRWLWWHLVLLPEGQKREFEVWTWCQYLSTSAHPTPHVICAVYVCVLLFLKSLPRDHVPSPSDFPCVARKNTEPGGVPRKSDSTQGDMTRQEARTERTHAEEKTRHLERWTEKGYREVWLIWDTGSNPIWGSNCIGFPLNELLLEGEGRFNLRRTITGF